MENNPSYESKFTLMRAGLVAVETVFSAALFSGLYSAHADWHPKPDCSYDIYTAAQTCVETSEIRLQHGIETALFIGGVAALGAAAVEAGRSNRVATHRPGPTDY